MKVKTYYALKPIIISNKIFIKNDEIILRENFARPLLYVGYLTDKKPDADTPTVVPKTKQSKTKVINKDEKNV